MRDPLRFSACASNPLAQRLSASVKSETDTTARWSTAQRTPTAKGCVPVRRGDEEIAAATAPPPPGTDPIHVTDASRHLRNGQGEDSVREALGAGINFLFFFGEGGGLVPIVFKTSRKRANCEQIGRLTKAPSMLLWAQFGRSVPTDCILMVPQRNLHAALNGICAMYETGSRGVHIRTLRHSKFA